MPEPTIDAATTKLITFDCYGTLIDWETGIREVLSRHLEAGGVAWDDRYFDLYVRCEAQKECEYYRPYRTVLDESEAAVLAEAGLAHVTERHLARSLPRWKPFPDTVAALKRLHSRYQLGVLSNIDRDLFARTAKHLGVAFDLVITSEDVRYYKPGPAHFEALLQASGLPREQHLHAAQSLFHDIRPCNELGIPCVWINRRGETERGAARPWAELPDMAALAEFLVGSYDG